MAQVPVFTLNAFPQGVSSNTQELILYGTVTFTGSGGYSTGGLPITWKFLNPDGSTYYPATASWTPFLAYFQAQDGSLITYQWFKANNTMFAQTGGAQVANATTLSGAIAFEVHFAKFN